ncbi:MAG: hypothetical protein ACRC33_24740 [Gemmataceae bacterium]
MAFRDFSYPDVQHALGLTLTEADLYSHVAPLAPSPDLVVRMQIGAELALGINTEKARSEFLIAPLLLELRVRLGNTFAVFSGVEFDVDASRGLNGFCDYLLSRSPIQTFLTAPLIAVVEAKNDNVRNGLGQCIATMVAAREFNGTPGTVHGAATTGAAWRFLRLDGSVVTLDRREYFADQPGRILGILAHLLTPPAPAQE